MSRFAGAFILLVDILKLGWIGMTTSFFSFAICIICEIITHASCAHRIDENVKKIIAKGFYKCILNIIV